MHIKKIALLCLCGMLTVAGCATGETKETKETESILPIISESKKNELQEEDLHSKEIVIPSETHTIEEWVIESEKVSALQGMLCRKDDLLVLDSQEDKLLVLNYNGEVVRTVGGTGNGALEFSSPTGITTFENNIYILDGHNDRIQILDENLNYIDEMAIERREGDSNFVFDDIAIDQNETIYLSGKTHSIPGILYYKKGDTNGHWLEENFMGYLAEQDGKVFAVNLGLFTHDDGDKKKIPTGFSTGINYLFEINETGFKMVQELPFGIGAVDFVLEGENLVCVSAPYVQLVKITKEEMYLLGSLNIKQMHGHIAADGAGNYFSTTGDDNVIYVCRNKGSVNE